MPDSASGSGCKSRPRFAFATLLMMGDGYLPGAVLVGSSLSRMCPHIDRVCMVTEDVSAAARATLASVFTAVVDVPYIAISPALIRNRRIAAVYSRTFTKLKVMRLTGYSKVTFLDADTVPLRSMASTFAYHPPAGVFVGCHAPWASPQNLEAYKTAVACRLRPGQSIGTPFVADHLRRCQAVRCGVVGMETTIMVVKPDVDELGRLLVRLQAMTRDPAQHVHLRGDSTFLSQAWHGRWHMLDMRFLGRWLGRERDEVYLVDCYGNEGKPWTLPETGGSAYPDVALWWHEFSRVPRSVRIACARALDRDSDRPPPTAKNSEQKRVGAAAAPSRRKTRA